MEKKISRPSQSTRRSILSHAGNQCAFPACSKPIHSAGEMLGQIAHIEGRKFSSARFRAGQSPEERNGYDNLIAVCHEHGTYIDDQEQEETYTVAVLKKYKSEHEQKIEDAADRNWLLPPNSITGGQFGGMTVHFWYDRNDQVQVYSDDQLATCNALMQINISLSEVSTTFQALRSHPDHPVKSVMEQSYAKVGADADNMYAHFVENIVAASDVTFGEFIRFIVQGNDATKSIEHGEKFRKEMIEGKRRQFWRNPALQEIAAQAAQKLVDKTLKEVGEATSGQSPEDTNIPGDEEAIQDSSHQPEVVASHAVHELE